MRVWGCAVLPSMSHSPGDPGSLPGTQPVKSPPRPPASPHSWLHTPLTTLVPVIPCDLELRSVIQTKIVSEFYAVSSLKALSSPASTRHKLTVRAAALYMYLQLYLGS